tara:strand:- start:5381 stop:6250 length:870 start_codon:yes stop_codon:yes gene_type:complete
MSTKIIGNQIDATTRAIMEALQVTEQINLPALNQTAVTALGAPAYGTVVYNSTEDAAQIYKQDAAQGVPGWTTIGGGGPSVGENSIIRTNGTEIAENLTIGPTANGGVEFTNGFSGGPITIANGYTVTIETGATWNIIGGQDASNMEVASIITQDFKAHGLLHFGETKESITYYTSSGTITHPFSNNNVVYVSRTGGGNFTFNLTGFSTNVGDSAGYGITIICENAGAAGAPTTIQIDGVSHTVYWSGGNPSHSSTYLVCSLAIIDKIPAQGEDTDEYLIFGTSGSYGA